MLAGCFTLTNDRIIFFFFVFGSFAKLKNRADDNCFVFIRLSRKVHRGVVSTTVIGHTVEAAEQMTQRRHLESFFMFYSMCTEQTLLLIRIINQHLVCRLLTAHH